MLRKMMILAGIAGATMILAQGVVVHTAVGRGVAGNEAGARGKFDFEAKRAENGANVRIDGRFRWETLAATTNTPGFVIESRVRQMGSHGNVAEFSGPGVLIRRTPNGPVRVEGILSCRVVDNRRPEAAGNTTVPDRIAWKFARPNSNEQITFEGNVRDGDIKVAHRQGQ